MHVERAAVFTCSRCGSYACEACAFSSLAGREICRACAAGGLAEPIPWERRAELGRIRAFWETTKILMRSPMALFRTPTTENGMMGAAIYGIAVYTLGQLISIVTIFGLLAIGSLIFGLATESAELAGVGAGYSVCWMFLAIPITLGQSPIYGILGIVGGGGLTHLSLRLFKQAKAPFETTMRVVSYANAPYILYAIPVLGMMIAWFWVLYLEVVGVREAHGISTDKAAAAVLLWRFLLIVLFVGAYVAMIFLVAAAVSAGERPV